MNAYLLKDMGLARLEGEERLRLSIRRLPKDN
jgi:hypothetical protein